jgi:hypothetical protein
LRANGYFTCFFCCVLAAAIFIGIATAGRTASQAPRISTLGAGNPRMADASSNFVARDARRSATAISFPITFEPNLGQADPAVQYVERGTNMTVLLCADGIEFASAGNSKNDGVPLKLQFTRYKASEPPTRRFTLKRPNLPHVRVGKRGQEHRPARTDTGALADVTLDTAVCPRVNATACTLTARANHACHANQSRPRNHNPAACGEAQDRPDRTLLGGRRPRLAGRRVILWIRILPCGERTFLISRLPKRRKSLPE